jgi:hypothetical protein
LRRIIKILHVQEHTDKNGETYWKTHAMIDDGSEVQGYGKDFAEGDWVESFLDLKWNIHKIRKPKAAK